MSAPVTQKSSFDFAAGPRLRCFLSAPLLLSLVLGFFHATVAYAATCPVPPELCVKKIEGRVYGPSGIKLSQILVRLSRDGKLVAQTKTDGGGRFRFKSRPGHYDLELLFVGSTAMNLKVHVGRGYGSFFHPARLWIVLGLSGTRCGFATTNANEFKKAIKRFNKQLLEIRH